MTSFGKIYRQMEFRQTAIGKIPTEWEIARLNDLCEVVGGATPSTSVKEYWNGEIPFVTPTDVTELEDRNLNFLNDTKGHITKQALKNSSAKLLPPGTVLVTSRATIGYVAINEVPVATNQGFASLICNKQVDNIWILYLMRFLRSKLESLGAGSTYKEVSRGTIKNLSIALPTKAEQEKIGRVLSSVEEAIQKTNEIIAKTELLKKGLMQQLLTKGIGHKEFKDTEIGRIPKEWNVVEIGDVARTTSGGTPSRTKKEYYGGDIPWVKSGELKDNTIYNTEETITDKGLRNSSAKLLRKGTLLVALYGATVGKTAILGIDATTNQAICAIMPREGKFESEYLKYQIILRRNQLISASSGGAQPNISQGIIRAVRIPLPALNEQRRLTKMLSTVDTKLENERSEKTKLDTIKQGLMDLFLMGKIRIKVD